MRYIKLFEDVNTNGYEEISGLPCVVRRILFTKSQEDFLLKIGFKHSEFWAIFVNRNIGEECHIYKDDDEWYYIDKIFR